VPPFWQRALLMPFLPTLWSAAARWRPLPLVLSLVVLVVVVDGGLAFYRGFGAREAVRMAAEKYDASYPAVVIDDEGVHVEGDGVIRFEEGSQTFLVDPGETVPLDDIKTPEYVVVRRHQIIRRRLFRTEVTEIEGLRQLLGSGPTRIDGNGLRAFEARWGLWLQIGLTLLMIVAMLMAEGLMGALAAAAGAGVAFGLRGREAGLTYGQCFKIALASYSLAIVLGVALNLAGKGPGHCLGLLVWPALVAALATWRSGAGFHQVG
jgi:hypothetical protein